MKNRLLFYIIAFISILIFSLLQLYDPITIREQIESKTYDLRLHLRNLITDQPRTENIIIVSIDEKSIREIGRWPWKRDVIAELVKNVSSGKPKAIGIDILFTERETPETDRKLAAALREAGNVVLATPFIVPVDNRQAAMPQEIPDMLWDAAFMEVKSQSGIDWKKWAIKPESVMPPLAEFAAVSTLGHAYTHPDLDGVIRWNIMYLNYGDDCYPQFSLQVARIALGLDMKHMTLYGGSGIGLGDRFISTDLSGRVLINYRGRELSFPYLPAVDVIRKRVDPAQFRGSIVLIGTSALATYDQKVTPFSGNMPGVEENANVVANIVSGNFMKKSPGIIEVITIALTGGFLGFTLPRLTALTSASLAIGFTLSYGAIGCYLLAYHNLWINLLYPMVNMLNIFTVQTITRFFHEEKRAKDIRRMFSNYVSPKIVKELIDNPDKAMLSGERRVVTVIFSDIIGFTSISERKMPEEVVSLLNEYFQEMVEIIFRWDGTLDKFVGDEIMAFWGAPVEQPNHAELAVRCALHMSERLNSLQKMWKEKGVEGLDCGIGINTGEVLVGNIGAPGKKMDYTVIGDQINLAARVEKLTRQYGTRILLTENTVHHIEPLIATKRFGHFELTRLSSAKVKGKEQEIIIYGLNPLEKHPSDA